MLVMFSSCAEHKVLFDYDKNVNADFFKEIPGIGSSEFLKDSVFSTASFLNIYQSTFSEKFVEKDSLLEYTEFNDSTKIPLANYWDVDGYSQNMYLVKYQFTMKRNRVRNAAVFFSVKYKTDRAGDLECIGFGPAYFGITDTSYNYFNFSTELTVQQDHDKFWLKFPKKIKTTDGYLFMPAADTATTDFINIKKIVKLDANKIGGHKPLVFNIQNIFHDSNALLFHYQTKLDLKP